MLRFYLLVIFSLHLVIYYAVKMGRWSKDESHSPEEKYALAKEVLGAVNKRGRIKVEGFGLENLPDAGGYVMYPNHQGRYDALGIITTHEKECRVVIDASRVNNPLLGNFLKLLCCKELEKDNPRQGVKLFKEVGEEITNGERYIIFPEGQHSKNRNNLQEFHTVCMSFLFKTKCPIVPVVLYDTYKPFEINSYKKVKCEVHYLEPIYPEEYGDLSKQEIADLVKERIEVKLEELKLSHNE